MTLLIQILLVVLLIAGIFAVLRLYFVLGDVRNTLSHVETTRKEIDSSLQRLEALLRDELAPTLRVARETLTNVEVTTRALAETTLFVRRISGTVEGLFGAARLLKGGADTGTAGAKKPGGIVGGLMAGIRMGVSAALARKQQAASNRQTANVAKNGGAKALSSGKGARPVADAQKATTAAGKQP